MRYGSKAEWTEERIALLIDRWNAGDSASIIARKLACGFTRNAVIGKVHRLKLRHRTTMTFEASANRQNDHAGIQKRQQTTLWLTPAREKQLRELFASPLSLVSIAALMKTHYPNLMKHARRLGLERPRKGSFMSSFDVRMNGRAQTTHESPPPSPALPPEDSQPVTLMARQPHQCGWILGDTNGPDTIMCGAPKPVEQPYCAHHHRMAHWHGAASVFVPGMGKLKLDEVA